MEVLRTAACDFISHVRAVNPKPAVFFLSFFLIRSTFVTPLRAHVTPETSKSIVTVLQLRSLATLGADLTSVRSLGTHSALTEPNERS